MANEIKHFVEGIGVVPVDNADLSSDTLGEIQADKTNNKTTVHNGTTRSPIVTEDHSATLTNKAISGDDNTITDVPAANVDNVPSGNLSAVNVQDALNELQTDIDSGASGLAAHIADPTDAHDASAISNIPSGNLAATDIQGAVNELQSDIDTRATTTALNDHINDATDAHDASAISSVPSGNLAATDVQTALDELQSDIDTRATTTALNDHINDATDAHDGSAISNVPSGNLAATDVQSALNELQTDIDTRATTTALNDHINDATDAHAGSAITNTPSGNLAATTVQGALNELQTDVDTRATSAALAAHEADTSTHGVAVAIVGTTDTQTLTAKTFGDAITLTEIATPSNPSAGSLKFYAKSDDKLYYLKSSGVETQVGAGAGGTAITMTAGETLAAGEAVYISSASDTGGRTTGRAYKLDATNDVRIEYAGIVTTGGAGGASITVQVAGEITGLSGLTTGAPVFASVSTPGAMQNAAPSVAGQWIIQLGTASSSTTMIVNGAIGATAIKVSASTSGSSSTDDTVINYITNGKAEQGLTTGWSTYAETDGVTFQIAADTVTLTSHGLQNGNTVSFTSITTTTGITAGTLYYVVGAATNTFQVASTLGGSAINLATGDGSGTLVRYLPKTGSGGSPTITWTASGTTPLRGSYSFLFTKDAANRMGQGVSYDFTVDRADSLAQTKPLQITFDYEVASGTYSGGTNTLESDLECWIYDVTNAQIIQPAGFKIDGNTMRATFQPSKTSSSYRLILQVATVSASAWTMKIDKVVVAPNLGSVGPAMSDWQSYTGSLGYAGTTATNITSQVYYRSRVGDAIKLRGKITFNGAANASGVIRIPLPSGITIDTSKLSSYANVGQGEFFTNSKQYDGVVRLDAAVTTYLLIHRHDDSGATDVDWAGNTTAGSNVPGAVAIANGDVLWFNAEFPVTGWSSNTLISDSADTRVVALRASNTSGQSVASASNPVITGWTSGYDTHGAFNTSTGVYTVKVPGKYRISAGFSSISTAWTTGSNRYVAITLGGSKTAQLQFHPVWASITTYMPLYGTTEQEYSAGDTISIQLGNGSGSTYQLSTVALENWIAIDMISGPSQIAASEVIAAKYTTATAQAIVSSTICDFNTKVIDTHNAVTTGASWKFTAPASGIYRVSVQNIYASVSYVSGNLVYAILHKNGSADSSMGFWAAMSSASVNMGVGGSAMVQLNAGEFIDVRLTQGRGSTNLDGIATDNHITIERLGGVI